jgi:hypothetical protein
VRNVAGEEDKRREERMEKETQVNAYYLQKERTTFESKMAHYFPISLIRQMLRKQQV